MVRVQAAALVSERPGKHSDFILRAIAYEARAFRLRPGRTDVYTADMRLLTVLDDDSAARLAPFIAEARRRAPFRA